MRRVRRTVEAGSKTGEKIAGMDSNHEPGTKFNVMVWMGLLFIAGVEVFVTYRSFSTTWLLVVLLILAFLEAGIALLWFMHLKYERPIFLWSFVLSIAFVLLMMNQIWPDAYRMMSMGHR
jgi:cytochrome c oxidase subunit IV